jgi:hypothetical protein
LFVDSVAVLHGRRSVNADADRDVLPREDIQPLRVDQHSVGLDAEAAGGTCFGDSRSDSRANILQLLRLQEQWLSSVERDSDGVNPEISNPVAQPLMEGTQSVTADFLWTPLP